MHADPHAAPAIHVTLFHPYCRAFFPATPPHRTVTMKEILEHMQRYFDLMYTCDVTQFERVFHANAQLQTVGKDGYALLTHAAYKEILRQRKSPASSNAERRDEMVTVDQSSPTSAFVKARVLINGTQYCDYLSMLKVEGSWRIAAKIYCIPSA
jgi:hypothetical protein